MVELRDVNEFHEYIVPLWFNDTKAVTVKLKSASIDNIQKASREQLGMGPEAIAKASHEFVKKHVGEIKNLSVGGVDVKSFDDLRERGPHEFYSWISTIIYSSQELNKCEIKN